MAENYELFFIIFNFFLLLINLYEEIPQKNICKLVWNNKKLIMLHDKNVAFFGKLPHCF